MAADPNEPHRAPASRDLAQRLLRSIEPRLEARSTPFVLGISGLQGSGKSTLARALVECLPAVAGVALSLDDFYLDRSRRRVLADRIHPLFLTRGVPGTHDPERIIATLDALARASSAAPVPLPRFDKGRDEPAPAATWPVISTRPRLIVLEGWCLAVPAQAPAELATPVNALEREEDPDGRWRAHVNAMLAGPYARLWQRIDHLVLLQAPGFEVVTRWREQAERGLRARQAPRAMDAAALARFIAHYERLSRHALGCLPGIADTVVVLDAQRHCTVIHQRRAHPP